MVCMALAGLCAAVGVFAWTRANAMSDGDRIKLGFWGIFKASEKKREILPKLTPEQRAAMRDKVQSKVDEIVSRHPELEIRMKPVLAEHNGFLLLYELSRPYRDQDSAASLRMEAAKDAAEPWDPVKARAALQAEAALMVQVEAIAALTTRSSSGMPEDYSGFISARSAKYFADLLLLQARLAAEDGDEAEALRLVSVIMKLAEHYSGVEESTLMCETVAILIEGMACETAYEKLIPAIGGKADLALWRKAMAPQRPLTVGRFADVLRAEWNVSAKYFLLPMILDDRRKDRPKDRESLIGVFSELGVARIVNARASSLQGLLSPQDPTSLGLAKLSKDSREIVQIFYIAANTWGRGFVRAAVIQQQYQAALDLMILEKSGRALSADSTKEVPPNPLDGLPFAFDPGTRVLSTPPLWEKDTGSEITLPGVMP